MNPTNFPGRLKQKRLKALENLRAGTKTPSKRIETKRSKEQLAKEIARLEELTR